MRVVGGIKSPLAGMSSIVTASFIGASGCCGPKGSGVPRAAQNTNSAGQKASRSFFINYSLVKPGVRSSFKTRPAQASISLGSCDLGAARATTLRAPLRPCGPDPELEIRQHVLRRAHDTNEPDQRVAENYRVQKCEPAV